MKEFEILELVRVETKRLSSEYKKDFLDVEDLIKITGLGKDNVRAMVHRKDFPSIRINNRIVVSIVGFVNWYIRQSCYKI